MYTVLVFIAVISILIIVHELGHLLAAKWAGIYADEFAIGMGPKLFTFWNDGETSYTIRLFPIGGFVRMQGEDGITLNDTGLNPERSFMNKSVFVRAVVLVAGIAMNALLGMILIAVVLFQLGEPISTPALEIVDLTENSPAQETLEINTAVIAYAYPVGSERTPIVDTDTFVAFIDEHKGEELELYIITQEDIDNQALTGMARPITPRTVFPEGEGPLGIAFVEVPIVSYQHVPLLEIPTKTITTSFELVTLMITTLKDMLVELFTQGTIPDDIAGVAGIAKLSGEIAREGFFQLLQFMALISLNLSIVNILPFPALDGGRLVFVIIEGLTGKRVSPKYEGWIHAIGFIILLGFMGYITYLDILRFY